MRILMRAIAKNHELLRCIILEVWPIARKLTVIARMLLLFAGPFGLGAYLCGLVFINKDSPDRGKQKMKDAMEKLKEERTKLWVFPEGYRNHSGSIEEFKKGAFYTAIQAQVPIVPVVFSSYRTFMRKKEKVFNSGEIIIEALPAISTKGLKNDDVQRLLEQTREAIINKYNELNLEIENKLKVN